MKFHKVKEVSVLPGLRLSVQFANCTTKIYDTAPLIRYLPAFAALEDEVLFGSVEGESRRRRYRLERRAGPFLR